MYATLHSKHHVEHILDVVNRRHRMARWPDMLALNYVRLALKARQEET